MREKMTKERASEMVRDIARNAYEVGHERGFKRGKQLGFGYGVSIGALGWGLVILLYILLAGCAPVAEVGFGYEVDGNTVGRNPAAHVYLGLETTATGPLSGSCGWYHTSRIREGTPFNENWETYSDQAACFARYSWADRN